MPADELRLGGEENEDDLDVARIERVVDVLHALTFPLVRASHAPFADSLARAASRHWTTDAWRKPAPLCAPCSLDSPRFGPYGRARTDARARTGQQGAPAVERLDFAVRVPGL